MKEHLSKIIQGVFILVLALVLPVTAITWARSKTQLSPATKAGQKVFQENCAMCHFANQAKKKIGPGMKSILKNKELPYSHKPATVANIREQIEKGNPDGKPMPMPPFGSKLSKSDMSNLIAYLKTL